MLAQGKVLRPFFAQAPGKLVIAGEYAVLAGFPALAMAVNRRAFCRVTPAKELTVTSQLHDKTTWNMQDGRIISNSFSPDQELVRSIFQTALEAQLDIPIGHYHLDSSAFYRTTPPGQFCKLGLGSSSAITVAFMAALLHQNHRSLNPHCLFVLAQKAHLQFSGGYGSGIDIAAACFGGFIRFQNPGDPSHATIEPWTAPKQFLQQLLFLDTGRSQDTRAFLRAFFAAEPETLKNILQEINSLTEEFLVYHRENYALLFNQLHLCLEQLGQAIGCPVVNPTLKNLASLASLYGGAIKGSGAGGGDLALAVIPELHQKLFQEHLSRLPCNLLSIEMESAGACIVEDAFAS